MKVQPTENQQLLHPPDELSVTYAKKRRRDVAPNQVSQDPFSNLVTLKFLEPALNQKLRLETRSPIGTVAILFFAKPKFVLAQWEHGWRIAENRMTCGVFNSASTDLIKGMRGCQADFYHFRSAESRA